MEKIRLALIGMGKMGQTLKALAQDQQFEVICEVDQGKALNIKDFKGVQVAIEFTAPGAAYSNIKWCIEQHIPVVSGTTGWTERLPEIRDLVERSDTAFFYASNFSIGMQITFYLNRQLARIMQQFPAFGAHITEVHHTQKLDKPSGTAVTLADAIVEEHDRYAAWSLDSGDSNTTSGTLPVQAKRIGDVRGIHEIVYSSGQEEVLLRHAAHDRSIFASGALQAARWLIGKRGNYTFADFLNFEKDQ